MQKQKIPKYMEAFFIHGRDVTPKWDYSHHLVPPITSSVTFRMESAERAARAFHDFANTEGVPDEVIYIYERLGEPSTQMLEERLAAAEKGDAALVYASGMAAIHAATCGLLNSGEHLISHRSIYGCTYSLFTNWFPRLNIEVSFADLVREDVKEYIRPSTRMIYFETPINPTLELVDIQRISEVAREVNETRREGDKILVVVDNTFASPVCQRPLELGADIVVASLTKHIGGFNTTMGGVVVMPRTFYNHLLLHRKDTGGVIHGRSAWHVLVYGLTTLPARMRRQQESAIKLAEFLRQHPKVRKVYYPGLETYPQYELARRQMRGYDGRFMPGCLIYFVLESSDLEKAKEDGTKLINWMAQNAFSYTMAVSLGCIKTLIEHPSSMTHAAIPVEEQRKGGIHPGGIRVAVGLEEPDMLIEEMEIALRQI